MTTAPLLFPHIEPRRQAMHLFFQGYPLRAIAELLQTPEGTVSTWKKRDGWDDIKPIDRVDFAIEARMCQLIAKDVKSGGDFKEIDLLGRQLERIARVNKYSNGGNETDLNPKVANRNKGPKKAPERNVVEPEQQERLIERFESTMFGYQRTWYEAGKLHRIRDLLKSRQIGATYFFAFEAFIDALVTGRNQIFLSASKAQAHVFKQYIIQFAKDEGVELKGDPMVLPNGAHMYFLGTNARTAQSYHGNIYMDEYFWIHGFLEFRKVASGMAMHKKWRQTYISTPSSLSHPAYAFWSGANFNRGKAKADRVEIDLSHANLAGGKLCADRQWRQIVTVEDAVRGGCDLFDLDELRGEYSEDEYRNLLMCEFMDDTASVFPLASLQRCMVDSWELWEDYKPFALRPLGSRPVWIGYDPAKGGKGDSAGCAVLAPPAVPGGKFRVLERHRWSGMDFAAQAEAIRQMTIRYNAAYIGIDSTGIGEGVLQLVRQFYPAVTEIQYNPSIKIRMVMKAMDVIDKGRLEFDSGWNDLAAAFMSIRRGVTAGKMPTFEASRSEETSHADIAWATMQALLHEPLAGANGTNTGSMEFF
ncbi:terminase ATPase subunit family protein [Aeromonas salmonicida]|uniref:terminase ATPase subunit family protein n=1 Tax=Aeromonas salmonicida TaxID=645 RepID=UPI000F7A8D15|nr:terminase ATPase subunit family protein [Aeromonas salmonicida]QYH27419.1 terminase ATPase subunit family protein [Aeromonas salmonicida subsp. masoucida]QYH31708.1 terminase ATPase subunit family protein [Aeromonas salmonicida subsp. masoucida]RSM31245.1 oxidoreductase [Aeromonas salmonicida]